MTPKFIFTTEELPALSDEETQHARAAARDAMDALSEDNADERALFDVYFESWRMLLAELGFRCRNRRLGKVGCA